MFSLLRHQAKKAGVSYVPGKPCNRTRDNTTGKPDKLLCIMYRLDGKTIEEKVGGGESERMPPAKAAKIREQRVNSVSLPKCRVPSARPGRHWRRSVLMVSGRHRQNRPAECLPHSLRMPAAQSPDACPALEERGLPDYACHTDASRENAGSVSMIEQQPHGAHRPR